MVDIQLADTGLEEVAFAPVKYEKSDGSWAHLRVEQKVFMIRCGPEDLEFSLDIFCSWADREHTGGA